MYEMTSELAKILIDGYSRRFVARLTIKNADNATTVFEGNQIVKISGTLCSSSGDTLSFGDVAGKTLTAEIISENPPKLGGNYFKGKEIFWQIRLANVSGDEKFNTYGDLKVLTYGQLKTVDYAELKRSYAEWIPMGRFMVDDEKWERKHCTLECSDKISQLDVPYIPTVNFPCRSSDIESDILNQKSLELSDPNSIEYAILCDEIGNPLQSTEANETNETLYCHANTFAVESLPQEVTMREMLSYIASYKGGFAVTDRQGKLTYSWYGNNTISLNPSKCDEPKINGKIQQASQLKCYLDEEHYIKSNYDINGSEIVFFNPYMTENRLKQVKKSINYYPCELPYRSGDPRLDIWDVCSITVDNITLDVPIMSQEISFDGGFSTIISSYPKEV